ncbi:MAG: CDP-diacylglycerol--serine O-phosphatidyltransferase [Pirellulales bacterium]|nr:CDP-diacylglycerol--serine O-phosphatidyltransferase [Pirellulales bacterium]
MKHVRAIAVLPTLFTLGNLVCGFFAIVVAARIAKPGTVEAVASPTIQNARQLFDSGDPTHNLMFCGLLIFVAMICDMFDGHVARITRTTSDFGGQLDSLCDVVSFGVAPAILLVKMCPQFTSVHREAVWSIAALFASCAALRLARFNVEADEADDHGTFAGLPSPAAAAVIASFAMLRYWLRNEGNFEIETFKRYDDWLQLLLPPFAAVVALLMVSRVPYPHLVSQFLRRKRSFSQVVTLVFALMVLKAVWWYAIPILCGLYAAVPAIQHVWVVVLRSKRGREAKSGEAA